MHIHEKRTISLDFLKSWLSRQSFALIVLLKNKMCELQFFFAAACGYPNNNIKKERMKKSKRKFHTTAKFPFQTIIDNISLLFSLKHAFNPNSTPSKTTTTTKKKKKETALV